MGTGASGTMCTKVGGMCALAACVLAHLFAYCSENFRMTSRFFDSSASAKHRQGGGAAQWLHTVSGPGGARRALGGLGDTLVNAYNIIYDIGRRLSAQ